MKEEIKEWRTSEPREPVEMLTQDFDWQGLYAHLGEDLQDEDPDPRLGEAVARLLQTFLRDVRRPVRPQDVGLRVIALAWVLNPAYFEGSPSVSDLADQCGVRVATLAGHTGRYSRMLRWRNGGQRHSWNWTKQRVPILGGTKAKPESKRNVPPYGRGPECESAGREGTDASACESLPEGAGSTVTPSGQ